MTEMGIRIERISVRNLGPLQAFDQVMKQVNLFYGHNETGKTYLVEFIYRSLFKHLSLSLRNSTANGLVTVSGLETNETAFSPSGRKKLEDFWADSLPGLPADFSKLLVVKGADLDLEEGRQGINEAILKEFLSGEGLLDRIAGKISKTVAKAAYENGIILGNNAGELKGYYELKDMLDRIDIQIEQVDEQISGGKRAELAGRIRQLEEDREEQENAKQHLAFNLGGEIAALKAKLDALPQEQISKLDNKVQEYHLKEVDLEGKKRSLEENREKSRHFDWLVKAADDYEKLVYLEKNRRWQSGLVWLISAAVALVAAIVLNFINQPIFGVGAIVVAAVFFAVYLIMLNRTPAAALQKEELEKIAEGYRERFNETGKIGSTTLAAKKEELQKYHSKTEVLVGDVEGLKTSLDVLEADINHLLSRFPEVKVKKGNWQAAVNQLQAERNVLDADLREKENRLSRLDIPEADYRQKEAQVTYDPDAHRNLVEALQETREELDGVEGALREIKQAVCGLTGEKFDIQWEDLIGKLQQKRADTVERYQEVTARIIAGIKVNEALDELREVEAARIDEGLRSKEVSQALLSTTGHYNLVEREDSELVLSDKYGRYPLGGLSTGAREQVLLALRMGFAARLLNGTPLFLILDDAFQHSDWERRENLVGKLFSLAGEGWQVLYFTMDDHIRRLFEEAGKKMGGDGFQSIEM